MQLRNYCFNNTKILLVSAPKTGIFGAAASVVTTTAPTTTTATAAAATPFSFGTSAAANKFSLFGKTPEQSGAAPTTTTAAATTAATAFGSTLTGGSTMALGAKPTVSAATTTSAPAEPTFAFGTSAPAAPVTTGQPTVSPSFPSSTTMAPNLATSIAGAPTTSTVTSAGSTLSSLLFPSKTTAAGTGTALTATTVAPVLGTSALATTGTPAAASVSSDKPMTYAQLEQLVNRLTLDVETQQQLFMSQVLDIGKEVKQLEEEKNRFLHTVDFISQQQTELETLVVDLEKSLGLGDWTEMTPIGLPDPGISTHADVKRQEM
ncbi:unnamed protein product [Gongylonema pulchrum]|uniref:Nsp1_C domain-containing protein n=1 Tax=Gongylonema pulchrum TaxID=637853 RepID=A0A183E266_9BILA|nr:unnamed protein product [Gongylonema pulchrum]